MVVTEIIVTEKWMEVMVLIKTKIKSENDTVGANIICTYVLLVFC
jgi:hypothetical protein